MSHQLINRSPDLKRLRDEGYDIEVKSGYLLVKSVPYVNSKKEVRRGILVSNLALAGDMTAPPHTHVAYFIGEHPCRVDGTEIAQIKNQSAKQLLADGVVVDHTFSAKPLPSGRYADYHEKMTTYVAILSGYAQVIDPSVTAKTFQVVEAGEEESVFKYIDTASSRAEIIPVTGKLALAKVAIVGLGGSGSYVLDLVAKTPVKEIHLFDGDAYLQHNAFRSPGAPSIEELREKLLKTTYFARLYSKMHRGIVEHGFYVGSGTVEQLQGMDFVFLCLDRGDAKRLITEELEGYGVPFVDVGMGLYMAGSSLGGIVRVTSSTGQQRDPAESARRIPFSDGDDHNEYARNIQIADLNALSAALAVIRWKKLFGFYLDFDHEHHSTYTIDGNMLINEDKL